MPTTVTNSIGTTGRTYSTLQAWEDACPANLVTDDKIWRGECYNDSEFGTTGTILTLSGITTDATRYVELTAAAGQSFVDNANVQTNALRYNQSNGVGVRTTSSYAYCILGQIRDFKCSRIQFKGDGTNRTRVYQDNAADTTGTQVFDQIIAEYTSTNLDLACGFGLYGSNKKIRNSLCMQRANSATNIVALHNSASAYNCTFVAIASPIPTNGVQGNYGTGTLTNCYVGNATNVTAGTTTFTKTTCYTSVSGPPSGWSAAAFSTSSGAYFQNITGGTHDFRIKTDSVLKDAGTTDSTNAATDIAGTSRPSGSAYDVGCWEFVQAAAATSLAMLRNGVRFLHMMVR